MKQFLLRWTINTLSVLIAVELVRGIDYNTPTDLLVASLLLGVLNTFLRPILMVLSLPLVIFTLGLFMLFINGLVLYFVGYLLKPHFTVAGFWPAFWGALVISISTLLLNSLMGVGDSRVEVRRGSKPAASNHDDGSGPVIDV